jgi:hypothetical protein
MILKLILGDKNFKFGQILTIWQPHIAPKTGIFDKIASIFRQSIGTQSSILHVFN